MDYIPTTDEEKTLMLKEINVKEVDELFVDIPTKQFRPTLKLPEELSEIELKRELEVISQKNKKTISFLGGGIYNHFVPSTVDAIISRGEFFTAYTPYQPEMSQGTLQAIFEYQSMICDLTGMDICNASLYDGATALAEGMFMATRIKRKKKVLVSKSVNPKYMKVLKTYAHFNGIEIVQIPTVDGKTDISEIKKQSDYAGVLVQHPNYFGVLEDLDEIKAATENALLVTSTTEAISWGALKPFSEYADIVTAEGQSFGLGMNFGGPLLGIFATKKEYMRQMPGRIIGQTKDKEGKRGFVLTISTREQHIRREKATSNICSNEGLCALSAAVYLATIGNNLKSIALRNNQIANYFVNQLTGISGIKKKFSSFFFNEFVVEISKEKQAKLKESKIEIGISLEKDFPALENCYLVCCTEQNTLLEMEKVLEVLE